MGFLKGILGLGGVLGAIFGITFVVFVVAWVFRILGFIVALICAFMVMAYVGWEYIKHCFTKEKGEP